MRVTLDFQRATRSGVRSGRPTLVVHMQAAATADSSTDSPPPTRVGFVVSKAVGNAVTRNRVKRRLRHLVRDLLPQSPPGLLVVVRALPRSADADELASDLVGAWQTCLSKLAQRTGQQ